MYEIFSDLLFSYINTVHQQLNNHTEDKMKTPQVLFSLLLSCFTYYLFFIIFSLSDSSYARCGGMPGGGASYECSIFQASFENMMLLSMIFFFVSIPAIFLLTYLFNSLINAIKKSKANNK